MVWGHHRKRIKSLFYTIAMGGGGGGGHNTRMLQIPVAPLRKTLTRFNIHVYNAYCTLLIFSFTFRGKKVSLHSCFGGHWSWR